MRLPPHARIIGDVHLLNVGAESVTGHLELSVYAIEPAAVTVRLAPFHLTYETLDIPAQATSRFAASCDLASQWQQQVGAPLSMRLFYALPHTHALGTRFFLEAVGGSHDGQALIDVSGFNGRRHRQRHTSLYGTLRDVDDSLAVEAVD